MRSISKIHSNFTYIAACFILPSKVLQVFYLLNAQTNSTPLLAYIRNYFSNIGTGIIITLFILCIGVKIRSVLLSSIVFIMCYELIQAKSTGAQYDFIDVISHIIGTSFTLYFYVRSCRDDGNSYRKVPLSAFEAPPLRPPLLRRGGKITPPTPSIP